MKRAIPILLCLLMTLMITSCQIHIDTDPWPASPGYGDTGATEVPVVSPTAPAEETAATNAPAATATPITPDATDAPPSADDNFVPVVTPTPQPSNDVVEPGFNG